MLVFSGDSDGVCSTIGTQHWVWKVKNTVPKETFNTWYYEDSYYGRQTAGYLTKFENRFSFATIHDAGHEVPAYQPQIAAELLRRFLDDSLFDK